MRQSRARTALLLILVLLLSLRFDWLFWVIPVFTLIVGILAAYEYHRMGLQKGIRSSLGLTIGGTIAIIITGMLQPQFFLPTIFSVLLVLLIGSFAAHIFVVGIDDSYRTVSANFLGPFYVGVPLALALQILQMEKLLLVFVLVLIWTVDSAAYFAGRRFGKHKLAPALSPKKTWEGAIGGVIGTVIVGLLFKALVPVAAFTQGWGTTILLSIMVAVVGPIGDLAESALKRDCNIKDSGGLFGGHGGALDRIDSLLFCLPLAYVFLLIGS